MSPPTPSSSHWPQGSCILPPYKIYKIPCMIMFQAYTFIKASVDDPEEFVSKLMKFGVTISQYQETMELGEIVL